MEAKLSKDEIRKVYRKIASKYDVWSNLAESEARRRCLEFARIKNGDSVLEVAVGTGVLFQEILKANPSGRNEGIDLTVEMLVRSKERAERSGVSSYRLQVGDAYNLEHPNEDFDVVLNNYMFDLIPEKDFFKILTEFKRVLRKGGRVVLVNMTKGEHWFNGVWEWLYKINPSLLGGCRGVELTPYLENAGFEQIKRVYVSQFMFPSEVLTGVKPTEEG